MKIFYLFILCFCQFYFIQCGSSTKDYDAGNKSTNDYFPLKNNMSWKYINDTPGKETETVNVVCRIENSKVLLDKFPFFGDPDSKMEINADKSGNISVIEISGASNILLPTSGKFADGHKWKYSDLLTAFMTKTPVIVKTEAGEFNCIFVNFTDGFTFSYEMWLAKGVGIVKWGANRTNPPSIPVYYSLKEYHK